MVKIKVANFFLMLLSGFVIIASFIFIFTQTRTDPQVAQAPTPIPTEAPTVLALNVRDNALLESPFTFVGKIDNSWLFEAQFMVKLTDQNGKIILTQPVKISDGEEWTTPGLKSFSQELKFKTSATTGFFIIENDNPSGLPENKRVYTIPVRFK